ncbi:toxin-antitoxin system COG2402 family toxin component [Cyanobacterium sp. HL-69]|nr:IS701 family transposase [Cyanobacterium sp. HL-69]AUC61822.1 toxin-antitoxin system COG2402 family toxin component [Cyanobacterium sp. HL-69]
MDVAQQIRKHLPRNPMDTVPVIDDYCSAYSTLFFDVRNYEYFKYLHLGLISDIKRKSLPEISRIVNVSSQSLHHFLTCADWNLWELEKTRLHSILNVFINIPITIIIDETGDRKKRCDPASAKDARERAPR